MSRDEIKEALVEMNEKLSKELDELIEDADQELQVFLRYYFDHGGKRLRPLITYYVTMAVGGDPEQTIPTATILELLHTFSLYHDDIIDRAEKRRGALTAYKKWGEEITLIGGDVFHALIHGYYAKLVQKKRMNADLALTCLGEIVYGAELPTGWASILEIKYARSNELISLEKALWVTENKTAPIFAVGARLGAIIGGADKELVDHMGEFGRNLGIAFQLIDDLLDVLGTSTKEKDVGGDFREKKKTPLLILAAEEDEEFVIQQILENQNITRDTVQEFIKRFPNVINRVKGLAAQYFAKAIKHLEYLPEGKGKQYLFELLEWVQTRSN